MSGKQESWNSNNIFQSTISDVSADRPEFLVIFICQSTERNGLLSEFPKSSEVLGEFVCPFCFKNKDTKVKKSLWPSIWI